MSTIDDVRARIDIVDLVGQRVALQKAGKLFRGLCPFHNEKTPSFYVYPEDWRYHCFGCNADGNGFDFVMHTERLEFAEALRHLAAQAGLELAAPHKDTAADEAREKLHRVLAAAATYYNHLLLASPLAEGARAYLERRGLRRETVETFQLGYSPDRWDALSSYLQEKGFGLADLAGAGLLVQRDDGRTYDRFRGRLMFPIQDREGKVIGFGGRALDDSHPKYLNSPQTALFDKSSTLYAFHEARSAMRGQDRAVIVEGYMDALMAHQYNLKNVAATMGTALSRDHVALIKRQTKNLVLALDPDAAGDEATLRGLAVAEEVFDRRPVPVPTWRGWVKYEYTVDANLRVMTLPPGKDPDEVIRADPAQWLRLVEEARPVVDFLFAVFTAKLNPAEPADREQARVRLLPVVREISDRTEQARYLQRLARFLGVHEQALRQEMLKLPASAARAAAQPSGAPAAAATARTDSAVPTRPARAFAESLDDYCLALLLRQPELRPRLAELAPQELQSAQQRQVLQGIARGLTLENLRQELGAELAEYLDRLLAMRMPKQDEVKARRDWEQCLRRLRQRNLKQAVAARGLVVNYGEAGFDEAFAPNVEQGSELHELYRSSRVRRKE